MVQKLTLNTVQINHHLTEWRPVTEESARCGESPNGTRYVYIRITRIRIIFFLSLASNILADRLRNQTLVGMKLSYLAHDKTMSSDYPPSLATV